MSKRRKASKFQDYFEISIDNNYTCKNCKKFCKKIDVTKSGTNSLKFHLETKHSGLYKVFQENSKSIDDTSKPVYSRRQSRLLGVAGGGGGGDEIKFS